MRAVAYVRVSSRGQDDATQRHAIEQAAAVRGDTITAWYAEKRSAKTTARAELQRLRDDVRAGVARKVYVFKLDRLVRTGVGDTFAVVGEIRSAGAALIAVADNLTILANKDDVTSEVLIFAFGLAAKLERSAINDRIAAARERADAEGRAWGRPSRVDRATRARAVAMHATGKSVRQIAQALRVPRSTIGRAIARGAASQKPTPSGGADHPGNRGRQ